MNRTSEDGVHHIQRHRGGTDSTGRSPLTIPSMATTAGCVAPRAEAGPATAAICNEVARDSAADADMQDGMLLRNIPEKGRSSMIPWRAPDDADRCQALLRSAASRKPSEKSSNSRPPGRRSRARSYRGSSDRHGPAVYRVPCPARCCRPPAPEFRDLASSAASGWGHPAARRTPATSTWPTYPARAAPPRATTWPGSPPCGRQRPTAVRQRELTGTGGDRRRRQLQHLP